MASYKDLGDELECPVCRDHFKVPKVMGSCLHAACFECMEQLIAARGTNVFPCPVCREKCKVPTQGVAALKDDFRLRAIVEKYQNLGKDKDVIHCIACSNPASHFCKACENSYLCKTCSGQHSKDPLTTAHELIGICRKHGKTLALYCRKCNTAICSVCLISDHPSSSKEHDVVPHQEVADEEVAALAVAVGNLETAQGQKENALSNIIHIREGLVDKIDSDLSLLVKQSVSVIEQADKTFNELESDRNSIQEEIEALTKRMKAVDEAMVATDNRRTSARQKNNEYSGYLNMYRDTHLKKFEDAVKQTVVETDDIKARVEQGRKVTSLKRVLDDQTVPSLQKVKEELVQTLTTAEQIDSVAPFVDATEKLPRFVPANAPMEIGYIRRREFTKVKKSVDISFPADRPCIAVYGVVHLLNGHLACLYQSNIDMEAEADTITLHDPACPEVCPVLMKKSISPAVAMTVTTKGELVVLRTVKPAVRIFRSRDIRDIDIGVNVDGGIKRWSIECDGEDNMFIVEYSFGATDASIWVFNPSGVIITKVYQNDIISSCRAVSYCRLTRTMFIIYMYGHILLRYHWDGTTLKQMPSVHISFGLGFDEFECTDVCACIGDGGEVFVAGALPVCTDYFDSVFYDKMVIWQVVAADENESKVEGQQPLRQEEHATASTDNEATFDSSQDESTITKFNIIELRLDDEVEEINCRLRARISFFGNTLAVGYGKRLELFHLIP